MSENNVVRDTTIHSTENNAVQFGSETCGDFRNIQFRNLNVTGASKAGPRHRVDGRRDHRGHQRHETSG